ncbi:hypothetical protein BHE74_00052134 [Ensete ventricosum]|uniref:Uncharacterized protein n=1 Tax=Ensete ventricosum TaxID=4639 RepID=A0A444FBT9_ENSVE|nr:hypothetical protein B296_00050989 [Ensete ventricosum]RWW20095.1 hypothetical protein GW17_00015813 [Ensete ventricosum]RWW42328.1 hypothetical protein BHE74_00052134 [Ensete ventricosum]
MESAARRRMESIGRHLLPPRILCRDLHLVPSLFACTRMLLFVLVQNPVSLTESNAIGSSPVIIGGMILDIHAKPFTDPVPGTTNPGEVLFRILQSKSIRTPVVSIVFDSSGELAAAVASVEAVVR